MKALLIFETVRGTSQRDEGKDDSSHNCAYSKNYEEEYGEIRHRRTYTDSPKLLDFDHRSHRWTQIDRTCRSSV